jgi:hypothetical protein
LSLVFFTDRDLGLRFAFVRTLPKVEAFLNEEKSPFIAKVYPATPSEFAADPEAIRRVERWWPPSR